MNRSKNYYFIEIVPHFNNDLLITILCTSLVPSYICVILASRINRSTWYSFT